MNCQNIVNTLKTHSLGLFTDQRKNFFHSPYSSACFCLVGCCFFLTFLVQELPFTHPKDQTLASFSSFCDGHLAGRLAPSCSQLRCRWVSAAALRLCRNDQYRAPKDKGMWTRPCFVLERESRDSCNCFLNSTILQETCWKIGSLHLSVPL